MPITPPKEAVVRIDDLKLIDAQRPLKPKHPALTTEYDMALALRILVSQRDDGSLYLLDGQHRVEGARRAGEKEMIAFVYTGLTHEEEADLFYKHNDARVGMNAQLKFNAAVEAGYPEQVEIKEIVQNLGGRINVHGNQLGINAVVMLERIYKVRGPGGLRRILKMVKEAWPDYNFSNPAASSAMLGGLAYFDALHFDTNGAGDDGDYDLFLKRLKVAGPEDVSRRGDGIHGTRKATKEAAYYYALVDTYNYRTRNGSRIEEGRPSWKTVVLKFCGVEDCEAKAVARGLCRDHYNIWYRDMLAKNQHREEAA